MTKETPDLMEALIESLRSCEDEYDAGTPGGNPFCDRPLNHRGDHTGTDPWGQRWKWTYE